VHRVDLLTRLVRDPKVDPSYGVLEEPLTEAEGQLGGAYIARIPCGPVNTYLRWVGAGLVGELACRRCCVLAGQAGSLGVQVLFWVGRRCGGWQQA
jgi:hypothetical protein